jgi:hypothetical protein
MTTITSYLYDNKVIVQILDDDPEIKTRNRIVYSRPIKVYQGVDNVITLQFRNNDQKAANIAGKSFALTLTAAQGEAAVWTGNVTIGNVVTAVGTVVLDKSSVDNLSQEYYNYTVSYTDGDLTLPAYVDDNWGAAGQLQVIKNLY